MVVYTIKDIKSDCYYRGGNKWGTTPKVYYGKGNVKRAISHMRLTCTGTEHGDAIREKAARLVISETIINPEKDQIFLWELDDKYVEFTDARDIAKQIRSRNVRN